MTKRSAQLDMASGGLPPRLAENLRQQNPWWRGEPLQRLPSFRRWPFEPLLRRLMREPPLAKINVVRGPRQIGKTTLQLQLIEQLLEQGIEPTRLFRVQFDELPSLKPIQTDEPILRIVEWFSERILGRDLNAAARDGRPALLFLDEVQNLPDWAIQLKAFVDRTDVRLLVTGSSALRIELGRDSLAGRFQTLEVGSFRLSEIAAVRGLGSLPSFGTGNGWGAWGQEKFWLEMGEHGRSNRRIRDRAFTAFSERGGYPLAQRADIDWPEIAEQLNETVIRRVILHDLRIGERGRRRDQQLLEETFRMAARYCGQAPSLGELARQAKDAMNANVGAQRVRTYIQFLDSSLLIRTIDPLEMRLKQRRGSWKLCLSDHALRAAWLDELVPLDPNGLDKAPELAALAGRIAESTTGYFLASLGIPTAYAPERHDQGEIDYVLTAGDTRVPIEVKYQKRIDPIRDSAALRSFMAKKANRASVGVIVTRDDCSESLPPGIVAVPLKTLLLAS